MKTTASRPDAFALMHGVAWRAASVLSRVAFLALIVPRTLPSEYGIFFSYSSLALLLSRVVSLGAIDNLPTKIKGDPEAMQSASMDLAPFVAIAAGVTAVAAAMDSLPVAALALALCMASGLALAGTVRSVSPAWFERWLNLHPIVFLGLAFLLGDGVDAKDLLLCQAIAILVSQAALRFAVGAGEVPRERSQRAWRHRIVTLLSGGGSRMISDTLIAGCIRAVAIGPLLLGSGAISDSLALALALGEAVWTVGMILVHRNFAFYCSTGPDLTHSLRSATVLLLAMCAVGLAGAGLAWMAHAVPMIQRIEPMTLIAALAFFAGFAALSELRYYDVATGKKLAPWVGGQATFLVAAAYAPELLGETKSLWAIAALTTLISASLIAHGALRLSRDSGRIG